MNKIIFSFFMLLAFAMHLTAQTVDEEIGFKYVKAEYLFGTERFEDAIKELNEVIKNNPNYKQALLLRANTKYKLAAYKGAKDDAMKYIEANGITSEAAAILGKADFNLQNFDAALNSLSAAIGLSKVDEKVYEMRAQIYENKGQMISACEDLEAAAKMGSTNAQIKARRLCGSKVETTPAPTSTPSTTTSTPPTSTSGPVPPKSSVPSPPSQRDSTKVGDDEVLSSGTKIDNGVPASTTSSGTTTIDTTAVVDSTIPKEDNTRNTVVVDEDLTLSIYGQGLGVRKVMEQPNILILSDEDAVVTVEVCVNAEGNVEFVEFDATKSTPARKTLVQLAVRKAKEFWFEKSHYPKMCGYIEFKIKGS